MPFQIKLEDGCDLPMIGINIKEEHEEWEEQLLGVLQEKGRYIEVPASGDLSEAAMTTIVEYAYDNSIPRKEFTIATSIMVPESVWDAVAVIKEFVTLNKTHIDLLYLENPVGLKGSDPMRMYNTSSDGTHPQIRKQRHMFRRAHDGRLKVTPKVTEDLKKLWRVLERRLVDPALVLSLGLRYFTHHQVEELLKEAHHRPVAVQAEVNLYCEQADLRYWCREKNIPLVAIHPYGNPLHLPSKDCPVLWEHPRVMKIAEKLGVDPKVILSRHILQNHLRLVYDNQDLLQPIFVTENVWRFNLTRGQMNKITKLSQVTRQQPLSKYDIMCVIDPCWPFCFIEEPEDSPTNSSDCEEGVDATSETTTWSLHDTTATNSGGTQDERAPGGITTPSGRQGCVVKLKKRRKKMRRSSHQGQRNVSTDSVESEFKSFHINDSKGSYKL